MQKISSKNPLFPKSLSRISSPPNQLFIEGDWQNLIDKTFVAVIGSRKASPYGRAVTEKMVQTLTAYGIVVVSGLALGIDSIAHEAALANGGLTVAVLAGGFDNIYPSRFNLAKRIIKNNGVLISEYPPHTSNYKTNFIARNRIIAGLSSAILITEAAAKSGSLHTANFALEQGKDVLCVPGPITSPTSVGCHNLIKAGAALIAEPADLLNVLGITAADRGIKEISASSPAEYLLLNLIQSGINDGDELQHKSELKPSEFMQVMSMLEITGRIKPVGGDKWILN